MRDPSKTTWNCILVFRSYFYLFPSSLPYYFPNSFCVSPVIIPHPLPSSLSFTLQFPSPPVVHPSIAFTLYIPLPSCYNSFFIPVLHPSIPFICLFPCSTSLTATGYYLYTDVSVVRLLTETSKFLALGIFRFLF